MRKKHKRPIIAQEFLIALLVVVCPAEIEVKRDVTPVARVWRMRRPAMDSTMFCRLVLALFSLLGIFFGFVISGYCSAVSRELRPYFDSSIARSAQSALTAESMLRTLVCYFRASIAAFLLGFSSLGVIGLPALFALQGFVLSFSLFSFAEVTGRAGFFLLSAIFAIRFLFVFPCTYLLGVPAMERSWALVSLLDGGRARSLASGGGRFLLCCLCLLLGCMLELWMVPFFLNTLV